MVWLRHKIPNRLTEEASRWLEDIFEYIALENPETAKRVVLSIYEHAQVLEVHPEIGYRYMPSERDVRILLYGHYRIAYLLKEDGNVDILGVFHGSLDIDKYQL
jgi:plasmid stabilization system protein ParE